MAKHGLLVEAAKKDPRFAKAMGRDEDEDMDATSEGEADESEDEGDSLDDAFSAKQAAAIRSAIAAAK
jgi:hypothetical protein